MILTVYRLNGIIGYWRNGIIGNWLNGIGYWLNGTIGNWLNGICYWLNGTVGYWMNSIIGYWLNVTVGKITSVAVAIPSPMFEILLSPFSLLFPVPLLIQILQQQATMSSLFIDAQTYWYIQTTQTNIWVQLTNIDP